MLVSGWESYFVYQLFWELFLYLLLEVGFVFHQTLCRQYSDLKMYIIIFLLLQWISFIFKYWSKIAFFTFHLVLLAFC